MTTTANRQEALQASASLLDNVHRQFSPCAQAVHKLLRWKVSSETACVSYVIAAGLCLQDANALPQLSGLTGTLQDDLLRDATASRGLSDQMLTTLTVTASELFLG